MTVVWGNKKEQPKFPYTVNTMTYHFTCLSRLYHFKFFKGCLPQILFGPFLNTLSHLCLKYYYPNTKRLRCSALSIKLYAPTCNFIKNGIPYGHIPWILLTFLEHIWSAISDHTFSCSSFQHSLNAVSFSEIGSSWIGYLRFKSTASVFKLST